MDMNGEERERFLAGSHRGLLSVAEPWERVPVVAPAWFGYEPGGMVRFSTECDERTLEAVRRAGRATLTVQEELAPHRCVSAEGPVVVYEPMDPSEFGRWVVRCLGEESGARYLRRVEDDLERMTTVSVWPERWRSRDLSAAGH